MVQFNELRITKNGKYLVIDVLIEDADYYDKTSIDFISIENQDTFSSSNYGPSSDAILIFDGTKTYTNIYTFRDLLYPVLDQNKDEIYIALDDQTLTKRVRMCYPLKNLLNGNGILFVYVGTNGMISMDSPCSGSDIVMRTVINDYPLYESLMGGIRLLEEDCVIPKDFINNFLRLLAVDASIRTGCYDTAIKYWKKFFSEENPLPIRKHKPCGCYGRH